MSNLKPLIFVHPLQDTLKELHKIMVEMAKNDGIEVYDIDSITEFNQLFSAVGQSVCIFGNPKKCAQALQANKKVNSKLHSKILLLTQKSIPRKTLEKFEKIGLTESINEPVAPKTLLYKVRLQLKSIASIQEQEEMSRKFGNDEEKSEANKEIKEKNGLSKETSLTDDVAPEKHRRETSNEEDLYNTEKRKSDYVDEKIDSHMKGKVGSESQEIDYGKKEKKAYKEEAVDQYYKGKTKTSLQIEEDEGFVSKSQDDIIDVADLKEALNLELEAELLKEENEKIKKFEEEVEQKKKEQKKLALEQEREKNKRNSSKVDQLSSHLKGSVSSAQQSDDEEQQGAPQSNSLELSTEEDNSIDESLKLEIDEEELLHRNAGIDLNIEGDKGESKKPSLKEKLGGHLTGESKASKEDSDENQISETGVEKIETHYKGHFDHQRTEEDHEEKSRQGLELSVDSRSQKEPDQNYNEDEEEGLSKKKSSLDIEAINGNKTEAKQSKKDEDIENDFQDVKPNNGLNVEEEEDADSATPEQKPQKLTSSNNFSQNEKDDDNGFNKTQSSAEDESQFSSLSGNNSTDKKEKKNGQADARADHLQKHYKGQGNSHQEQGWGNLHQKMSGVNEGFEKPNLTLAAHQAELKAPNQEQYDSFDPQAKKKQSIEYEGSEQNKKKAPEYEFTDSSKYGTEYQLNEKKKALGTSYELAEASPAPDTSAFSNEQIAIGDQVIDYNKLKKEFEAMGMDTDSQLFQSFLGHEDFDVEKIDDIEDLISEENQIFEAMPCGLDLIISVQELYHYQETQAIFDFIAQKILERYNAKMTVYKKEGVDFREVYSIFKNSSFQDSEIKEWTLLKSIKDPFWKLMTLPTLGDQTFDENENEFLYPIFEGKDHLAYIILSWDKLSSFVLNEELIYEIEAILESTRGLFLKEPNQTKSKMEGKPKEEKGLLGRFFGKRAS